MPLLEVDNVSVEFPNEAGAVLAVNGVSMYLDPGETLGIVGESGSGKSALVRAFMGLLPRSALVSCSIQFDGRQLDCLSKREHRKILGREIAMVFQDATTSVNPVRPIGVQIADPLRYHLKLSRKAAKARAIEVLEMVQIPAASRRLRQYPHELSGGMLQRAAIAIALACRPRILIADEPTTALDVTVQEQILDLLSSLQEETGLGIIVITHDMGVVAGRTDRVAVMYGGRVAETGPTAAIFKNHRHRYTEALLRSVPRMSTIPHTTIEAIPGQPPLVKAGQIGCAFAPRCGFGDIVCQSTTPSLTPTSTDTSHLAACWHPPITLGAANVDDPLVRPTASGRSLT